MLLLVRDDADGPPAYARIAAEQRLAVFRAVLFKLTGIHDARNDFAHVILLRRIARKDAVDLVARVERIARFHMAEGCRVRRAHLVHQRANALKTRVVVRLAKIHRTADCACIFAPPSSSAEDFCPMAACTNAGPARNNPDPSVIRMWSHITGRYAPPATHMPMIAVIWGMPMALITALLRKTRPKSSVSGKTSSCSGRKTPAESTR